MIVIADASPIIALYNSGYLFLLRDLYKEVVVTDVVNSEIGLPLPSWIKIRADYDKIAYASMCVHLDPGEASSIILAKNLQKHLHHLIIDERKGRKVAKELQLPIIGLFGIIIAAKKQGLIPVGMTVVQKIIQNGFYISDKILAIVQQKLNE